MKAIWKQLHAWACFGMGSLCSFALDSVLFIALTKAGVALVSANVLARVVSACFNYTYNRCVVFHGEATLSSALRYFALAAAILCLNSSLLHVLVQALGMHAYAAKALTECAMFLLSWTVQRHFVFVPRKGIGG